MASHLDRAGLSLGERGPVLWAVRLLLAVAALADGYLLWVTVSGGLIAGCGPESNCHALLNSRWAYWYRIPVSAPALGFYGLLFAGTFYLGTNSSRDDQRRAWQLLFPCAIAVLGAGLWFACLQFFILKKLCPYCMTAHLCGMSAAALLLARAPAGKQRPSAEQAGSEPLLSRDRARLLAVAGLAGVAALAGGQALYRPKSYASHSIAAGVASGSQQSQGPRFQIFGGQFEFKLNETPIIGRADAQHIIVGLFDYTCHHCRLMHPILLDAYRQFSNELAIVSLPMPLDASCNPLVKRTLPPHTNACALARIGLTVWTADPKQAAAFDDWVFAPATPPFPAEAEAHARQLVGSDVFDKAASKPWIAERLRQDIAIYEAIYRKFHKSYMPELIIGTNLISGAFGRDQLFQMLAEQFALVTNRYAPAQ